MRSQFEARLIILGGATADDKTEPRQKLMALAESLGVAADIDLMGFMPNPYAYMGRARVFVLSSAWEGFGNVLVEALRLRLPRSQHRLSLRTVRESWPRAATVA